MDFGRAACQAAARAPGPGSTDRWATTSSGGTPMTTTRGYFLSTVAAVSFSALIWGAPHARPQTAVAIDDDDIGGVVTGPNGPEAGVWVIAETVDLPTTFAKMVVTDDQGRYLIPDLPKANYTVWVRGYGLVDSPKVRAAPGKHLN